MKMLRSHRNLPPKELSFPLAVHFQDEEVSLVLLTKISHLVKALMGNPVRSRNVPSSKTIQKQSSKENHD